VARSATSSITFLDNNLGGAGTVRTDAVIDDRILFQKRQPCRHRQCGERGLCRDADHHTHANDQPDPLLPETRLLTREVRLRGRNY
jgi:hypothetical protein